jgi:small-conductance mechanosensitive channel
MHAQLRERAESFLNTATRQQNIDSLLTDTLEILSKRRQDSIYIEKLMAQIQEMKLNEILLRSELDDVHSSSLADSIRNVEQHHRIDSLRQITDGVKVVIDRDTLFELYATRGGLTPQKRAENTAEAIRKIGTDYSLRPDSVYIIDSEYTSDIMYGDKVVISITDQDGLWQNTSKEDLARRYLPLISNKIQDIKKEHSIWVVVKRVFLFLVILVVQYFLFKLTSYLFRKLRRRIIRLKQTKLKPISVRDYEFLNTHKQGMVLIFLSNLLKWVTMLIQLAFSIPMLFAIFPQTESLALRLFSYVLEPIKMILKSIVEYIPNLFIILIITFCIRYIIMGIQYIANEIKAEKLKITGFYPDWAQPTFNIIRFLLYAFMIAMIYPYLPGSDSGVFQGISVFVGLIISLGSSTVIGNIIAGFVITYMRPFKLGDRIKLNDTVGNVIEKTPLVTRIRTPKNEVVTIPNSFMMSSHTTNYSESARQYGLIIHTNVTFGYEVNWQQIHELLIQAALETPGVSSHPKPFVLDTELHDYYTVYQINAYIKDANKLSQIYSDLHQKVIDKSNEAGLELMSPHYFAQRDGNKSTIPTEYLQRHMEGASEK